jgi:serine/threonine protein kinase
MRDVHLQLVEARGTLEGRFSRIRRVDPNGGNGHFSLVFLVDDDSTGTEAVLKVFNPLRRTSHEAYRWESFERESRILQRLIGQRDIIQLVSGQAEFIESIPTHIPGLSLDIPFAYYVMERADSDMFAVISKSSWNSLQLLNAFRCMVRAVQRIHSLGIVHRDLKPDNFLVTPSGIKLSDFGTARLLDGTESPILASYDMPVGDTRYTPPESFALLHDALPEISFKGDVFALGAILFEMFTGVNLGVQLFGPSLLDDLTRHLVHVPRAQRADIYHQLIDGIAKKYSLPAIQMINPEVQSCIRDRLNELYGGMCGLNYRTRNCSFPSIFRQIDTCVLILRNEIQFQRWQAERQRRRAAISARKANRP